MTDGESFLKAQIKRSLLILAVLTCLLAGCGSAWHYDPITDVNNLEGRRVGVNLAWETDYYLTGRQDLELYRYDQTADMIMALSYNKIDAIALDHCSWKLMESLSDGVERTESYAECGYIAYFGANDKALMEDFNLFLKDYKQTPEYQELVKSIERYDGMNYEGPRTPLTGTGEVLHVAVDPAGYPRGFVDADSDIPTGFDVEPLKCYANDRGYQLDFSLVEYNGAIAGLQNGAYDAYVSYLSDAYAPEVIAAGLYVSEPMHTSPLYFVQKTQDKISVKLEELE